MSGWQFQVIDQERQTALPGPSRTFCDQRTGERPILRVYSSWKGFNVLGAQGAKDTLETSSPAGCPLALMDSHLTHTHRRSSSRQTGPTVPSGQATASKVRILRITSPKAAGPQVAGALTALTWSEGGVCPGHQAANPTKPGRPRAGQALQAQRQQGGWSRPAGRQLCPQLPRRAGSHAGVVRVRTQVSSAGDGLRRKGSRGQSTPGPYTLHSSPTPGTQRPRCAGRDQPSPTSERAAAVGPGAGK